MTGVTPTHSVSVLYGVGDVRLEERPTPRPGGQHVLVTGVGPIELCAVQAAGASGATRDPAAVESMVVPTR